jgi:hypothetical protein
MAITSAQTDPAVRAPWHHTLRPVERDQNVLVERSVLFAGHAECPGCGAFVRRLSSLGARSIIGELVAGWCSVCCTTTFFAVDDAGESAPPAVR